MYWAHRFGVKLKQQIIVLCHLIEHRNCLTIGWYKYVNPNKPSYNPDLTDAVNSGDIDKVKSLAEELKIGDGDRDSLINFMKMQADDIVLVLPSKPFFPDIYIVKIKSPAKSILQAPESMQKKFITISGEQVNFDPTTGFKYFIDGEDIYAGFFHEVEVLKKLPYRYFNLSFTFKTANIPIVDVSQQQYIDSLIPKPK